MTRTGALIQAIKDDQKLNFIETLFMQLSDLEFDYQIKDIVAESSKPTCKLIRATSLTEMVDR